MKLLIILFLAVIVASCSNSDIDSQNNMADNIELNNDIDNFNVTRENSDFDAEEYIELEEDMFLSEYYGEKISFSGTIAQTPKEFIKKQDYSITEEKENYMVISLNNGEQVVVYCNSIKAVSDNDEHIFYGKVGKTNGNNSSGETVTEYYLDLEFLK